MPISESFGIPYKAMHRCSHGGSYTVEQHRFCTACTMQKHWPSGDNSVPLLHVSRSCEPASPWFSLLRACLFDGSDSLPARACAYNRMTRSCRYTNVDTARIAAVSCSHSPFTSPVAHARLMELLDDVGPTLTHFVHCGDLLEAAAASVHADEHDHTLADEFEHASNFLRSIREALPESCRLIWMNGNHDDNIFKRDPRRIPKALRDMIEIGRDSRWPEFSNWTQHPYAKNQRGQVQIGQVVFFHGFDAGQTSDELEALQFNNITGGHSHRLFVRGHTHRPVPPTQCHRTRKVPLPYWYANVGTLGPLTPDWASRMDTSAWGAACLITETKTDRPNRLCAKNWNAELVRLQEI